MRRNPLILNKPVEESSAGLAAATRPEAAQQLRLTTRTFQNCHATTQAQC
jgi:hypothetical protein